MRHDPRLKYASDRASAANSSAAPAPFGAASVGRSAEPSPANARALRLMRLWAAGLRAEAETAFLLGLGSGDGAAAFAALEDVMALLCPANRQGDAPSRRAAFHAPACGCLGGDENAALTLVAACLHQDHDTAALLALHLAPHCPPAHLLGRAEILGLALAALPAPPAKRPVWRH